MPPRRAMPWRADLGAAMKHLDDAQFDALRSSVAAGAVRLAPARLQRSVQE